MLTAKKNGKSVDLAYTFGDTFKFGISSEEELSSGTIARFQVSRLGGEYDLVVDKTFDTAERPIIIFLSSSEAKRLKEGNIYNYRISFIDRENNIITQISGDIEVKWGA